MKRAAALALATALGPSCLEATQITVEITSDLDCAQIGSTSIFAGPRGALETEPRTSTSQCTSLPQGGSRIGSIVVIPSVARDAGLAIHVATALKNGTCGSGATKCIDAHRALGFIPHASLKMPIVMSSRCIDVPCGTDRTCVEGNCASAGGIANAKPASVWHFDEASGSKTSAIGLGGTVGLANGVSFVPADACNSGLAFASGAEAMQLLPPATFNPTTELGVWFRFKTASSSGSVPLVAMIASQGFEIALANAGPSFKLRTTLAIPTGFASAQMVADGKWHTFQATWKASTGIGDILIDGQDVGGPAGETGNLQPVNNPLLIGGSELFGGVIDELYLYDKLP